MRISKNIISIVSNFYVFKNGFSSFCASLKLDIFEQLDKIRLDSMGLGWDFFNLVKSNSVREMVWEWKWLGIGF